MNEKGIRGNGCISLEDREIILDHRNGGSHDIPIRWLEYNIKNSFKQPSPPHKMSALSASRPPHPIPCPAPPVSPNLSPVSSYSPLPSLTHSSPCSPSSSSSSLISIPERTNEHLAVLLPKHLWKVLPQLFLFSSLSHFITKSPIPWLHNVTTFTAP